MTSPTARAGTLFAALLAVALLVAACGSDDASIGTTSTAELPATVADEAAAPDAPAAPDEPKQKEEPGPSDVAQIVAAIEAVLLDDDNEFVCNEVFTKKFLGTAYGDLQGCLNGRSAELLARSIRTLDGPVVKGNKATATAVTKGGFYSGEPLDFSAVNEGDAWRIDSFVADIPAGP